MNRLNDNCPICFVGKNSKSLGGNKKCFHCSVCWFVECEVDTKDDIVKSFIKEATSGIKKRLKVFCKNEMYKK